MYWTIANWKEGDIAATLISPTEYALVRILKVKGSVRAGEEGNVLVLFPDDNTKWVMGGKLLSEENACKQIDYNRKKAVVV